MAKNTTKNTTPENEIVAEFVIGEDGKITTEAKENTTTTVIVKKDGSVETITNVEEKNEKTNHTEGMKPNPMNFVNNLEYMGKGMLGIFAVIGIIIVSVYLLAKIGVKKNND